MSQPTNRNYLLVGTVTKDLLADGSYVSGGTVTYAATVAKQLGWRPTIVTAAAPDFTPPAYLVDVDWRILSSQETTTFRNEYTPQGRHQTIGPIARSIKKTDIPADCHQATIVHLCPLAQDVTSDVATAFDNSLRAATPQGWLRQWDDRGNVSLGEWRGAAEILPELTAAVLSIEDVEGNWAMAERWARQIPILIVTEGALGCTVFHWGRKIMVPPRPSAELEPTGAGDVFAAAFFIRFYETNDLWQAAYFANVTASMSIELPGPQGVPRRDEIETYIARHPVFPPETVRD